MCDHFGLDNSFSANAFSAYLHDRADHTQNQILKHILSIDTSEIDVSLTSNKRMLDLVGKYAVAFVDYTVETQGIHPVDTEMFAAFYLSLPPHVAVESFKLDGYVLSAQCSCTQTAEYEEFENRLNEYGFFSRIEFSNLQEKNGSLYFTVDMYI